MISDDGIDSDNEEHIKIENPDENNLELDDIEIEDDITEPDENEENDRSITEYD
jgi:hypothetical protein